MRTRLLTGLAPWIIAACGAHGGVVETDPPGADVWTSEYHSPAIHYRGKSPATTPDASDAPLQIICRLDGHLPVYTRLERGQELLLVTLAPESADPGERIVIGWRDLVPGLWVGKRDAPAAGWQVPVGDIKNEWGLRLLWSPDGRCVACERVVRTGFNDEKGVRCYMTHLWVFDTVARRVHQVAWANLGHRRWRHEPAWTFDGEYLVYEKAWARGYHHGGVAAYRPADGTERMIAANIDAWHCYPGVGADGDLYCLTAAPEEQRALVRVDWGTGEEEALIPVRLFRHLVTTIWGDLLWRDERGVMLYDGGDGTELVHPENEAELVEYARTHPLPPRLEPFRAEMKLREDLATVEFNDGIGRRGLTWYEPPEGVEGMSYPQAYTWSRANGQRQWQYVRPSGIGARIGLRWVRWSRDGTWLLATGDCGKLSTLLMRADGGESVKVTGLPWSGSSNGHDWGPGNRLAIAARGDDWHSAHRSLWVLDDPHGQPRMLVPDILGWSCSWSPDGSQIAVVVGEDWGKTQVGLVDAATGQVTTITEVGNWESVAWHPSKPELAFRQPGAYGIMTTDGEVLFEHRGRYVHGCGARWSHDDRLRVGEDGFHLLDRSGHEEPVDRPFSGCYGDIGTLIDWTRDGRYAALLADCAIIIAEAGSLTFEPGDPWHCSRLKPGHEPVRIIYPEGERISGHACPTNAPALGP